MRYNWPEVKLSELCSYRQERVAVDELTVENYISTANMLPNKGGIEPTESLPSSSTANRYYAGDVLISNIRPYFKKAWYATTDGGCSSDVLVLRAKGDVHPEFLYYLLTSDTFFSYMTATSKGTKMPRGDKQAIMNWRARKPPLPTQRAIADTLSCLDAKIALNKRINENLEEQAQAIFKSWFVDFEPFQDSDFVESQYGWIPQGWRLGRLGEFIEVTSGKRPIVKTNQRTPNNKVPVIGASRVMGYTNESLFDDRVLVIGRVGTHGVVQRIDFPCWPSDNTLVIKSQFYEFAYQVLKRIDYSSINRGSTQPLITQRDLRNQVIVVPPESVLRRYEDVASSLLEVVRNNLRENQTLSSLRDTLLPKLMSGEIEVPIV
jgi:type I restriction enzyme S subunit